MLNAKEQSDCSCKEMVACSRDKRNEVDWPCPLAATASQGLNDNSKLGGMQLRRLDASSLHKDSAGPRGQTSSSFLPRVGKPSISEIPQRVQTAEDTARPSMSWPWRPEISRVLTARVLAGSNALPRTPSTRHSTSGSYPIRSWLHLMQ